MLITPGFRYARYAVPVAMRDMQARFFSNSARSTRASIVSWRPRSSFADPLALLRDVLHALCDMPFGLSQILLDHLPAHAARIATE